MGICFEVFITMITIFFKMILNALILTSCQLERNNKELMTQHNISP